MVICGQEFEFSLMNANDLDRFEDANERMQRRSAEESEQFRRGGVRLGDHARAQACIAMDCIDEILGAGASDRLGLDENFMAPIQGYKYGTAATPCIVWTEGDGTSAKAHDIDYIEIRERYNADSSSDKNTVEAVARVVKGSTYTTAGGATVTFASDGTVTASNYSGTLVGYRYMTLTEVSEQLASTQSALADADALNLDQDYRLTLLELGVTDDETTA